MGYRRKKKQWPIFDFLITTIIYQNRIFWVLITMIINLIPNGGLVHFLIPVPLLWSITWRKELCTILPRCTHASLLTFWTVWNASPVGRMARGNSTERHTLESTLNVVTGDESGPASRWPAHRPLPVATLQVLSPLTRVATPRGKCKRIDDRRPAGAGRDHMPPERARGATSA